MQITFKFYFFQIFIKIVEITLIFYSLFYFETTNLSVIGSIATSVPPTEMR